MVDWKKVGVGLAGLTAVGGGVWLLLRRKSVPVTKLLEQAPTGPQIPMSGGTGPLPADVTTTGGKLIDAGNLNADANVLQSEADDLKRALDEAKAALAQLQTAGQGSGSNAADLQATIDAAAEEEKRKREEAAAKRTEAIRLMRSAVADMNLSIYTNTGQVSNFLKAEESKTHPTALDTWVALKIDALDVGAHVREILGEDLPGAESLLVSGFGLGILTDEYVGKYSGIYNGSIKRAGEAKAAAKKFALKRAYANALFSLGQYDWLQEAVARFKAVWDRHEQIGHRTPTSVPMQSSLAKEVMTELAGIYTPKTSGTESPAVAYWNEAVYPEAIYLSGRWKAASDWYYGFVHGDLGWAHWNPGSDVPFWGDVDSAHWYYGGAVSADSYQEMLRTLGLST